MQQLTYFLSERPAAGANAGSKARNDVEAILQEMGCVPFEHIEERRYPSKLRKLCAKASPAYLRKLAHLAGFRGQRLILQYPFYYDAVTLRCLRRLVRQNHTLLVVHDVDALRHFGRVSEADELAVLRSAACLIVHNAQMAAELRARGVRTPMVELGVFDYLLDAPYPAQERHLTPSVAFAGNLAKSRFLQDASFLQLPLDAHLYGVGFDAARFPGERIHYHGSFPPDRVPYEMEGSFGIVWDGTSAGTCTGPMGEYLRYNNPHKLSLCLAAELPVITWREAAIAHFVEAQGIGFTVDALTDIPAHIAALSEADYEAYRENLRPLQQEACTGQFLRRALAKAEDISEKNKWNGMTRMEKQHE